MNGTREAALIDQELVAGLRAALGGGAETLMAKAAEMVRDRVARIAAAEPDEAMARLAHELGGVAGQVGLRRLSTEALDLERLCRAGEADAALGQAAAVEATARESLRATVAG
jgi:HPt (histidine-containing phosphotransfer) domain-containing protein